MRRKSMIMLRTPMGIWIWHKKKNKVEYAPYSSNAVWFKPVFTFQEACWAIADSDPFLNNGWRSRGRVD